MATEIKISLNGKDYSIKQDPFSLTVMRKGDPQPLSYPTRLGRAVETIVRDSCVDRKSKEVISLLELVERYEASKEIVLAIDFPKGLDKETPEPRGRHAKKQAEDFEF